MQVHLKADLTDGKGNKARFEMYPFPLDQITTAIEAWTAMGFVRCTLDMALGMYSHPKVDVPFFEVLPGPRGVPDNLRLLPHFPPNMEKRFNDLGIYHFWQIAGLSPAAAKYIGEEVGLPGRMEVWRIRAEQLTKE